MGNTAYWMRFLALSGICALALAAPAHAADQAPATAKAATIDQPADKAQILKRGRDSYYSLRAEGFSEFSCSVVPNWSQVLVKVRQTNPKEADRELKMLQASHFRIVVPAHGEPAIVPASAAESPAEQDDRSAVEYRKAQKMTQSFFLIWAGSVRDPLLPNPGAEYTLQEEPSQYRFTFHDGNTDVVTVTDRNMLIKSVRLAGGGFAMVLSPEFSKVAGGLLPSNYDLTYPELPQDEQVRIRTVLEYQLVDGLQLPSKFTLTATGGGESNTFEFSFVDCHASRGDAITPAVKK